jgi:hypothetical protein
MFITLFFPTFLLASVSIILLSSKSLISQYDIKDFDDEEALLAQEKSSALLEPPKEVYEIIHKDLAAIRKAFPAVANVHHQPHFGPNKIICQKFTKEMSTKLNVSEFGPIKEKRLEFLDIQFITFKKPYNMPALIKVLEEKGLATGCEVNHTIGGSASIIVGVDNTYTFYKGWGDCPAGCINDHYWTFKVDADKVTLVKETGNRIET